MAIAGALVHVLVYSAKLIEMTNSSSTRNSNHLIHYGSDFITVKSVAIKHGQAT